MTRSEKSPREWTEDELADWLISPAGPDPSPFDRAEGEALMEEIARRLRLLSVAHADLLEAAKLALKTAESWIHDELDGTSSLHRELSNLDPVRAAIAKAEGAGGLRHP